MGHFYDMTGMTSGNTHWAVLSEETKADLPLIHLQSRRILSLEQRRGDNLHPPLDVFEHLREPRCPKELVSACPMAGGMKPDSLLVHRLCAHRPLDLLFAPSTDRVRDGVAVLHASTLLPPHC